MRQSVAALCRIRLISPPASLARQIQIGLKLDLEAFLAEIEFYWFALLAAFPNRLEPLGAALAIGGLIPVQGHGFFFTLKE